jgi:hypothetical protein
MAARLFFIGLKTEMVKLSMFMNTIKVEVDWEV